MDFNRNHFELFGLPVAFGVDAARLDQAYRDMQAEIHPDRFAHTGEAEQRLAMQWSTRVNEAYQTLKTAFSRANYLLQLHGIDAMHAGNSAMPMDFLMRQMSLSETLAEARTACDVTALDALERTLRAELRNYQTQLGDQIDTRQDYPAAAETLRKLRFTDKLLADVGEAYEACA